MNKAGSITVTMRALDQIKVIQQVVDGGLKPGQAASRLALSCAKSGDWYDATRRKVLLV
jgi:hypothetical protein